MNIVGKEQAVDKNMRMELYTCYWSKQARRASLAICISNHWWRFTLVFSRRGLDSIDMIHDAVFIANTFGQTWGIDCRGPLGCGEV